MKIRLFVAAIAVSLSLSKLSAVEINYTSPLFEVGQTSMGIPFDASFTFTLGSFGSFIPTASNLELWAANFTPVPLNSTASWDVEAGAFGGISTLNTNAGAFATTMTAYIWGFNTQDLSVGSGAEWVLVTNPSWLFPASSAILPVSWDTFDTGTVAIVGQLATELGAEPYIATALVSPIPEPSTYAAIFGALALGFVAYRRRLANAA